MSTPERFCFYLQRETAFADNNLPLVYEDCSLRKGFAPSRSNSLPLRIFPMRRETNILISVISLGGISILLNPFIHEFLKWTIPSLNLDMSTNANRGFNLKSNTECAQYWLTA